MVPRHPDRQASATLPSLLVVETTKICATIAWRYGGGAQCAERHRTVIPGVTRMSFPRVKVPPLKRCPKLTFNVNLELISCVRGDHPTSFKTQRKRDDKKNKIYVFQGRGLGMGAQRKIVQNAIFRGKCHDNKLLKVNIPLSRNFVVMAQAPKNALRMQGQI